MVGIKLNVIVLLVIAFLTTLLAIPVEDKSVDSSNEESPDIQSEENHGSFLIESRIGEETNGELGSYFQGDILLTEEQKKNLLQTSPMLESRTGYLDERSRWPKNSEGHVVIPYIIVNDSKYNRAQKSMIRTGMNQMEAATCIRFVEKKDQADHLIIKANGTGCASWIGRIGGGQIVSLDHNCFSLETVIHELIHSLGYTHMHNHQDRDKYVKIYLQNVEPSMRSSFDKVNSNGFVEYGNFGTAYDYYSLMHYRKDAFALPGKTVTIIPKNKRFLNIIGQRNKLSTGDKKRINAMYKCNE